MELKWFGNVLILVRWVVDGKWSSMVLAHLALEYCSADVYERQGDW